MRKPAEARKMETPRASRAEVGGWSRLCVLTAALVGGWGERRPFRMEGDPDTAHARCPGWSHTS